MPRSNHSRGTTTFFTNGGCDRSASLHLWGVHAFDIGEPPVFFIYGLETVVSVLFTNTRTRWPQNEREIFNTARGVAEYSIENFEFIVLPASACICKQNTN